MLSIFKKEINSFFSSLIGYITIGVFLIASGLFIWVFPETSVLDYGYANLDSLFAMAPWFFIFLIPAITMRSFSEEYKSGTIELLATKPIKDIEIILGKYLATFVLVLFSIIPTFIYFYTVYELGSPKGNIDTGATWGSYIGLIMMGGAYVAIGVFASSLTDNQIIAFILGLFFCFFFYIGFDYLSEISSFVGKFDNILLSMGIADHYNSISRGVLDTKDVLYFLSVIVIFILSTKMVLQSRKW